MSDYLITKQELKQLHSKLARLLEKGDEQLSIMDRAENDLQIQMTSEQISNIARLLPTYLNPNGTELVIEQIAEALEITYSYVDEVFRAEIPSLLPKKEKGSARWIRASVQSTLREYIAKTGMKPLVGNYVVLFEHVYSRKDRQMRDHDNIELNVVMDSIALFLLVDDSPQYAHHHYLSRYGEKDMTVVHLIPQERFISYLIDGGFYERKESIET